MGEATFTFRVDEALKAEFAQAAKADDRTAAQLLRDFMRDYVRGSARTRPHMTPGSSPRWRRGSPRRMRET